MAKKRRYLQTLTFKRGDGTIRTAHYSFGILENAINDSDRMLCVRPNMISVQLTDKETGKVVYYKEI